MKCQFIIIIIAFSSLVISAQERVSKARSGNVNFNRALLSSIKDSTITIKLTKSKFDYLSQNHVEIATKASELLENYTVPTFDSVVFMNVSPGLAATLTTKDSSTEPGQPEIVSRRIIEDGGLEITYSDNSKQIIYKGGRVMISPDGKEVVLAYSQVPELVPPKLPDDPTQVTFLNHVNDTLLDIIADLLNGDNSSMANLKKGDEGLNTYEMINRHFDFINFIISRK